MNPFRRLLSIFIGIVLFANNHLSAQQDFDGARPSVVLNGIQLGEMNMLLLKKIEEMTLYQIELLKRLEDQNKRIELLELKIKR